MSTNSVEAELTDLKERVRRLEVAAEKKTPRGWREAFGALKDEPLLREAARLGTEWRAGENKRR